MELEKCLDSRPPLPCEWYKAKNWEDVEKATKVNGDYDERSVPGHELVSKLVLDPLLDHPVHEDDVNAKFSDLRKSPPTPHFVEAVKYMIARDERSGPPDVVVYHQWQQQQLDKHGVDNDGQSVESLEKGLLYCSRGGHNIIVSKLEHEADCMACENQVMRSDKDTYNCTECSLDLHKECAESFDNNNARTSPFPNGFSVPSYRFPQEIACKPYRGMGQGFSHKCASCLFETHLKCRLIPTVIKHFDAEEHLLNIVLLPTEMDREVYRCVACGVFDNCVIFVAPSEA